MKDTWDACGMATRAWDAQRVIYAGKSSEKEREKGGRRGKNLTTRKRLAADN